MGKLRNRVVPLHQTAGVRVPEKAAESAADLLTALPRQRESGRGVRIRLGRVREEGAGQQRRPETR